MHVSKFTYVLLLSIYLSVCLPACLSISLSVCLSGVAPVTVNSCRFRASSSIKILCFINLSTSFSYSISGRPRRRLRPDDQIIFRPSVIFHACHMSMPFQHVFHSFQDCLCYPHFSLMISFLTFVGLDSLQLFLKNPLTLYL